MLRWMIGCCAGWLLLGSGVSTVCADGGTLRACAQCGEFRISVFTLPTPLRAGPVDVSVLLQNAASGEMVRGARIEIRVWPHGQPHAMIRHTATAATATNKLFQAAQFDLPNAGKWEMQVDVKDAAVTEQLQFSVEADKRLPPWASMWPWFTWPFVIVLWFAGKLVQRA